MPTFAETLDAVPGHVFLNVEIKNTPGDPGFDPERLLADRAMDLVRAIDDPSRILMSSFDPESVAMTRAHHPDIVCGLLIASLVPIESGIEAALALGAQALHPSMVGISDHPAAAIATIRDAGLASVVWNANTPEVGHVEATVSGGVDIVITDDPTMARARDRSAVEGHHGLGGDPLTGVRSGPRPSVVVALTETDAGAIRRMLARRSRISSRWGAIRMS